MDYLKCLKLEEKNHLEDLYMISKLLNNIIITKAFYRKKDLEIIGNKIYDVYKFPEAKNSEKYFELIESLISSFQEILVNNKEFKREDYEEIKIIFLVIIKMDDCFINTTSKGLLFLSSKEIKLNFLEESELFRVIKKYSFQNENLLEILISQFKYIK